MTQTTKRTIQSTTQKTKLSIHSKYLFFLILILILLSSTILHHSLQIKQSLVLINEETSIYYALIGDIGGTNIRYQLISFSNCRNHTINIIKEQRLKVVDFQTFQQTINHFLEGVSQYNYPSQAVIAIAGPVQRNSVTMPNILKWGKLNGNNLASLYNFSSFSIINDFQAASYGLLITQPNQLLKLNNLKPNPLQIRGVIGPGTGLGHSIILNNLLNKNGVIILPSQAGHSDVPFIDQETSQYVDFLKTKLGPQIDLEKTFCGPSIPFMYEFYFKKLHPHLPFIPKESPQIVEECLKDEPQLVYEKVYELFIKFYSSAIANFMIQHMTTGGVYLIGGLTKAFLKKIEGKDILKDWKERHPSMARIIEKTPLIFCTEVDLGLRGSFYVAKRMALKNEGSYGKEQGYDVKEGIQGFQVQEGKTGQKGQQMEQVL